MRAEGTYSGSWPPVCRSCGYCRYCARCAVSPIRLTAAGPSAAASVPGRGMIGSARRGARGRTADGGQNLLGTISTVSTVSRYLVNLSHAVTRPHRDPPPPTWSQGGISLPSHNVHPCSLLPTPPASRMSRIYPKPEKVVDTFDSHII